MLRNIAIIAAVVAIGWIASETVIRKRGIDKSLTGGIQRIIDENFAGNTLAVSSVVVPFPVAIPFYQEAARNGIVPAKFAGYFAMRSKPNIVSMKPQCDLETYGYEVSLVSGNDGMAIAISPEDAIKVQACQ